MDFKKISTIVTLVVLLSGGAYKGITSVNTTVSQINENTDNIIVLSGDVKLNRLRELHRKALSDYYHWKSECQRTGNTNSCRERDKAKKRVNNLEKQIEELERERR